MARRAAIIVLDGLGIGPAHDTAAYGDEGSDTLGNVLRATDGLALPQLERLGLGCCAPLAGVRWLDGTGESPSAQQQASTAVVAMLKNKT